MPLLVCRFLITGAMLGVAWKLRTDLEGLAGAIVGVIGAHWLPAQSPYDPSARRRQPGAPDNG
jgi:hypothetical protein